MNQDLAFVLGNATNGSGNDIFNGQCDNDSPEFLAYCGTSLLAVILILLSNFFRDRPPVPRDVNAGGPYNVVILFANFALWNLLPNVPLFLLFHVSTTDMLPNASAMACVTSGSSLPFVSFWLLFMA